MQLSEVDKIILSRAARLQSTKRKPGLALMTGAAVAVALIAGHVSEDVNSTAIFWIAIVYVAISTFEKITFGMTLTAHKALILKLALAMGIVTTQESESVGDEEAKEA